MLQNMASETPPLHEDSPVHPDSFGRNSSSNSTPRTRLSNTSGEITFEGNWEEDDLVALSGVAGQSFHKIHTGSRSNNSTGYDQAYRRKLKVDQEENYPDDLDLSGSDLDGIMTPEELLTPDDMDSFVDSPQHNSGIDLEWDNDTPIVKPVDKTEPVPVTIHGSMWRTVVVGDNNYKLDLAAVNPYRQVLSHGGYYGEGLNAIVVFSACYLPDSEEKEYRYIMDNLFLYVVSTLELLVAEDYMIVFFNGGCRRRNLPPLKWLKKCYQMIHRRLRKNLKELVVVHPSWYIRLLLGFFRPFISSKFSKKLKLVRNLHELADVVPIESVTVPDAVQLFDMKLHKLQKDKTTNSDLSGTSGSSSASER